MRRTILRLILLLCLGCPFLRAQIWGGIWITTQGTGTGTNCHDVEFDAPAACSLQAFCTEPPNPIPEFVIGGSVDEACPNQAVNNIVEVWKADSMTEEVEASALAAFYHRTIVDQIRSGNCNGGSSLIKSFHDPYGCDPPPPPPTCHVPIPPSCPPGQHWSGPPQCTCVAGNTPIIIDTTGKGFHFTDPNTSCVIFNWGGKLLCTSWPEHNSGNAWLVYDRDNDNRVDSADELFGNFTPHSDGGVKSHPNPNGFLALAWYDQPAQGGNRDLIIDSKDAIWHKLKLWIDTHCYLAPQEPCSARPYELYTLPDKGIYSLSLVYNASDKQDQWGNRFQFSAVVNAEEVEQGERQKSHDGRLAYDVVLVPAAQQKK